MPPPKLLWILLIGLVPCTGFAADSAQQRAAIATTSPVTLPSSMIVVSPRSSPFGVPALPDLALARHSGGTDIGPVSEMKLRGVVSDTSAINVSTGNNLINEGALTNASGIPMVIQNSGNNVLIQSATIVNIQVR